MILSAERGFEVFLGEPVIFFDLLDVTVYVGIAHDDPGLAHFRFEKLVRDELLQHLPVPGIDLLEIAGGETAAEFGFRVDVDVRKSVGLAVDDGDELFDHGGARRNGKSAHKKQQQDGSNGPSQHGRFRLKGISTDRQKLPYSAGKANLAARQNSGRWGGVLHCQSQRDLSS